MCAHVCVVCGGVGVGVGEGEVQPAQVAQRPSSFDVPQSHVLILCSSFTLFLHFLLPLLAFSLLFPFSLSPSLSPSLAFSRMHSLVMELRTELDKVLQRKIEDPKSEFTEGMSH